MNEWNLLSGLAGALVVFLLAFFREWWRNEQERRGLLRLLLAEIDHNSQVTNVILERKRGAQTPTEDIVSDPDIGSLKPDTWHGVQGRAAALLPSRLMADVTSYYSALETFLTLVRFKGVVVSEDSYNRDLRANIAKQEGRPVASVPGAGNPYRAALYLHAKAGTSARDQINQYLNTSWSSQLILSAFTIADSWKTKSRQA